MRCIPLLALLASAEHGNLNGSDVRVTTSEGHIVDFRHLSEGKERGVDILDVTIHNLYKVRLVPSRGLNIHKVWQLLQEEDGDATQIVEAELGGWNSGVKEIVNPAYINQMDRAGSGFLDGFNEMVARCGYEYAGHAGEDGDNGLLTLHGKASNIPATYLEWDTDTEPGAIVVTGVLNERAFNKAYFTLYTTIYINTTAIEISIMDTLISESAYPTEYMSIYLSNFGPPILDEVATLKIPARQVSPFDAAAGGDLLANWEQLRGPTEDYGETIYNILPYVENEMTASLLFNKATWKGVLMRWNATSLPVLSLWKTLDKEGHGYFVSIAPGTSFFYNRAFQRDLGLVPILEPSVPMEFVVSYRFLTTEASIVEAQKDVARIAGEVQIITTPLSNQGASIGFPTVIAPPLLSVVAFLLMSGA